MTPCIKLIRHLTTRRKKTGVFHATKTLIKRDLNAGKTRYKRTQV